MNSEPATPGCDCRPFRKGPRHRISARPNAAEREGSTDVGVRSWWNRKKELINAGLTLNRAAEQWEKDMKTEANPGISIVKGLKAIAGLALFAGIGGMALFLLEPGMIEAALAAAGVNTAYAAAIVLVLRGVATAYLNWRKHNPPTPASQNAGPLVLLFMALASPAISQDLSDLPKTVPVTVPGETSPAQEPAVKRNYFLLSSGATRFFTPGVGDVTEIEGQIAALVHAPNEILIDGFARFTRTQGSEGIDGLLDVKTFRSIVAHLALRRPMGPRFMGVTPFEGTCSAGVSWSRDKAFDPADPNVWAVGCGLAGSIPQGSLTVKVGHNGAVGGLGVFGELVVNHGPRVRYIATYAIPFDATRFKKSPIAFTGGFQLDVLSKAF